MASPAPSTVASPALSSVPSRRTREPNESKRGITDSKRGSTDSHRERRQQIGNFEQMEQIGQGSFAVVYKARHIKKGTLVAIKSVYMSRLNKKLKDNLGTEIDILKDIRHPHIVGLFDCRETPRFIHLVMEWCPLGDLAYFMKNRSKLAEHRDYAHIFQKYPNNDGAGLHNVLTRHFLQQLASAIRFLRSQSLIHRDIKPQNLLIIPPKSYYEKPRDLIPYFPGSWSNSVEPAGIDSLPLLKLADFGFARWLPHTTMADTLCGSPLYMAPEILRYEKYDSKVDLWSVGAVTYEVMTGRPPFKAGNHIELLRKIESTQDNIKFPVEQTLDAELQHMVRSLLKRNPIERIGFDDFFAHGVLVDEIPDLAAEDRPHLKKAESGSNSPRVERPLTEQPPSRRNSLRSEASESQEKFHDAVDYPSNQPLRRPAMREAVTAPAGQIVQASRRQSLTASPRASPQIMPPPTSSASQTRREAIERRSSRASLEQARMASERAKENREIQEKAAQDYSFEREYVVVEKVAVEVNVIADAIAASPGSRTRRDSNPQSAALMRRNTTQVTPPSGNQISSARALQGAVGRRGEHSRSSSFDRKPSRTSTTSAISKAVAMASGRLMSFGLSPPLNLGLALGGRGTPSPPVYHPFPTYPTSDPALLAVGDKNAQPLDEDNRIRQAVEEAAHRSDVVYGFAEVKYKQLIPLAPSNDQGLGLKGAALTAKDGYSAQDDDGLTIDAIVTLSEEALVLYVKVLELLAQAMNVAGAWWAQKQRGEIGGDSSSSPKTLPNSSAAAVRINRVVQWVRDRFNEVLEKAEFSRLKLIDAQKRLPPDHPSHPSNHSVLSSAGAIGTSSDNVQVSPGVTAERLMYTRALEMGKSAAVNELVGEDLQGCEISYITAIRMLEAVLEGEQTGTPEKTAMDENDQPRTPKSEGEALIDPSDRPQILNVIKGFQGRLIALRRKLKNLSDRSAATTPAARRSPNRSPVQRPAQLASGAGSSPRSS